MSLEACISLKSHFTQNAGHQSHILMSPASDLSGIQTRDHGMMDNSPESTTPFRFTHLPHEIRCMVCKAAFVGLRTKIFPPKGAAWYGHD
jgi:hypothetical protein